MGSASGGLAAGCCAQFVAVTQAVRPGKTVLLVRPLHLLGVVLVYLCSGAQLALGCVQSG